MKAITCTQCGATIDDVSDHSVIVDCDYCGARIMLNRDTPPIEPPKVVAEPVFRASEGSVLKVIGVAVGSMILIPVILFAVAGLNKSQKREPVRLDPVPAATPAPLSPVWGQPNFEPAKPVPVVNYQPRISWDGPNDLEYFADPEVDISSVSQLSSEEVKKTVFKNRTVKLRVVINTEGEIDEVEAISGHPILVEAATASAKRTIFRSRSKPTTRVLTYTFRLLKD